MFYKIVRSFGPEDGERWQSYLQWRGLELTRFDSIDSIIRPNLFEPESEEDWSNCVNEDFKINLITSLDYAIQILPRYQHATVVGIESEVETSLPHQEHLMGFDIVDGWTDISLVTNWGTDEEGIFRDCIMANGLIGDRGKAMQICSYLKATFPQDEHTRDCQVLAIYDAAVSQE